MTRGLIIRTDGTMDYIESSGLRDIQKAVNGYIEAINFGDQEYFCYGNEDAKNIGLEANELATSLWYDSGQTILLGDYLAGDVVFFGGVDDEGNDIDIPSDFTETFMRYS